ncbi:hypothetical protein [Nocardiopsis sp. CC223A]|uniref:TPR repeat region-containing protein n=1 Tax=Nocardiopsis sp. CC223A TaxID=3044051 RepID=UPI002795D06E|nr:hypothetical protein [Nocardiopsis sp. CC223A]
MTAVETYEEGIESLKEDLARVVASSDDHAEKQEWVEYYKGKADEKWAALETSAGQASESLASGPTPEGIRELVEGGHLGDIPGGLGWVVTGDDRYFSFPPGIDGNDLARTFDRAADGDEEALRELDENLALVNAFLSSVASRQGKGDPLTERELEILGDLVETMDLEEPGYPDDGYFFANMNEFKESEHLTQEQKDQILATMGGSVLALSDESIGGGYDQLPQSIHEVVEGPLSYIPYSSQGGAYSPGWASDFEILTEMFDGANGMFNEGQDGPLIGGAELSANLTGTIAGVVEDPLTGGTDDETLQTMLDISTQNKDANYAILTGEYPDGESYMHPTYFSVGGGKQGTELGELIASLFSHEWEDDGAAVRGLTDWIDEYQASEDPEQNRMGSDAFLSMIETITSEEMQELLNHTGHDVEDEDNGVTWRDVSFTQLNPEIADSLADLFLSNIEVMESPAGFNITDSREMEIESIDNGYNRHGELRLDPATRLAFAEYIMGSEEAAIRLHSASSFRTDEGMAEYFGSYPPDPSRARESGILRGLIETALKNEHEAAVDRTNGAIDYQNTVMSGSVDLTAAVFNEIDVPGVSSVTEMMKLGFKYVLNEEHIDVSRDASGDYSPLATGNREILHAATALEEQGAARFEGVDQMRDPRTGDISLNPEHWVAKMEGRETEPLDPEEILAYIDDMEQDMRQTVWPGSETPAESAVAVVGTFETDYNKAVAALDNIG